MSAFTKTLIGDGVGGGSNLTPAFGDDWNGDANWSLYSPFGSQSLCDTAGYHEFRFTCANASDKLRITIAASKTIVL